MVRPLISFAAAASAVGFSDASAADEFCPLRRPVTSVALWSQSGAPVTRKDLDALVPASKESATCPSLIATSDILKGMSAQPNGALSVLFVDHEAAAADFLTQAGAYSADREDVQKFPLAALRKVLEDPKRSSKFLTYADGLYDVDLKSFLNKSSQASTPVLYMSATPEKAKSDFSAAVHVADLSVAPAQVCQKFGPVCEKGGVVVVDLRGYGLQRKSASKGEFIVGFLDALATSKKVGMYFSTFDVKTKAPLVLDSTLASAAPVASAELPPPRKLGPNDDDDNKAPTAAVELRIMPWQLAALLTIGFAVVVLIIFLNCLMDIDTHKVFEHKCLPVNKEY